MDLLKTLIHPRELVHLIISLSGWLVYAALFAIVFAETGLLVGFFLPGDSLLFTLGVVCGSGELNIYVVIPLLIAAAIIGDTTGYLLGRAAGPRVFSRPQSRLFNPQHLHDTEAFYAKHGGKTLIYARFVPIIRTFAPFVAGVACMPYAKFISFSIFGGIGWVTFMTVLGYSLGKIPFVQKYFDIVVLLIIAISLAPPALQYLKSRRVATS
ncbi:MAG: VTT domain-containing protein [Acidobacteriota bacterium]|nr:VTT domain-containing protein [Acidobacteriota bacterium]